MNRSSRGGNNGILNSQLETEESDDSEQDLNEWQKHWGEAFDQATQLLQDNLTQLFMVSDAKLQSDIMSKIVGLKDDISHQFVENLIANYCNKHRLI